MAFEVRPSEDSCHEGCWARPLFVAQTPPPAAPTQRRQTSVPQVFPTASTVTRPELMVAAPPFCVAVEGTLGVIGPTCCQNWECGTPECSETDWNEVSAPAATSFPTSVFGNARSSYSSCAGLVGASELPVPASVRLASPPFPFRWRAFNVNRLCLAARVLGAQVARLTTSATMTRTVTMVPEMVNLRTLLLKNRSLTANLHGSVRASPTEARVDSRG